MSFWNAPTPTDAYRLCCVSLVATFIAMIGGFVLFSTSGSSLCLVFGLENLLDFGSSMAVLWRFSTETKERETRACVAISFILTLLGIFIFSAAVADYSRGQESMEQYSSLLAMAFFSLVVFLALSVFKFRYAKKLDSESLYKDGVCSLIGTILAGALFVNTLLIERAPSLWWIDPTIALLCALISAAIGLQALYIAKRIDKLPIFSRKWWFLQHAEGDAADDANGGEGEAVEKESEMV